MSRKPATLSDTKPRRVGNGDERAGPARGPELRRILAGMRYGGLVLQHPVRRSVLQLLEPQL